MNQQRSQTTELRSHLEWLGYVQPVGLVVSPPAMLAAECQINQNMRPIHQVFLSSLPLDENEEPTPVIPDFHTFALNVLDWRDSDIVRFPDSPTDEMEQLQIVLPAYNETLSPTYVVPAFKPKEGESPWTMLIQELDPEIQLDEVNESGGRTWNASAHLKFERLLRESDVPCGLITNGKNVRLVYAPKGETSGYITFQVDQMTTVAGRPIFAALYMLLCEERMFSMAASKRLPAILANSRKYQNNVSTQLAQQVMAALFELLRGFQAADDQRGGELLKSILANDPQHVYHGLLTVLMRMVFILYAEDRGLVSDDEVYVNHYSVSGLFKRLRSDEGRFPDTMDQRYGAWGQLLTLFRLIYSGGQHGELKIPSRDGYLFDPNRYPFLEGRFDDNDVNIYSDPERRSPINVPHVSDGVIFRVLHNLLVLDGERLSYRTLDVEQIGSVYEAIMGFELQVSEGRSIAVKPAKKHGAPATVNLEALLDTKPADRAKQLKAWTDQKLAAADAKAMKAAETIEGLMSALDKKIDKDVTPNIVPSGAMIFQPSDERRRSGSHYTPRSLTEPIVKTTLEPILAQLTANDHAREGEARAKPQSGDPTRERGISPTIPTVWQPTSADKKRYTKGEIELRIKASERKLKHAQAAREIGVPHPSQILDLKICDPAMGSGAFLVEACRQLGDELIRAWYAHDRVPPDIPADEDEVLYARRLVAQRCLYGVDKNVMAVDLAKLSLWLVTLARDHAFTFLDHSLRHGDSLVGLTREQIIGFHWDRKKFKTLLNEPLQKRLDRATEARAKILNAREDVPYKDQEQRLSVADEALDLIRVLGDACVSCFFAESKKKAREEEADRVYGLASSYLGSITSPKRKRVDLTEDQVDSSDGQSESQGIDFASRTGLQEAAKRLRDSSQEHPVPAFHWEIEFPEVFSRENGGFDAFVGNPPFLGGTTISTNYGGGYRDWILMLNEPAHGKGDLVAHFFRRVFSLINGNGCFGLVATNSIAQGDTRYTGLTWICENDGTIYAANKRLVWPGEAAVVTSVVFITKQDLSPPFDLGGVSVNRITAFLFHSGPNDDPAVLKANDYKSFKGTDIYGSGFTFDDDDSKGIASPISEMNRVIDADERNAQLIHPYLGGEELNSDPEHKHNRYVIDFGERTLEEASGFPDLIEIVRERVKPYRDDQKRDAIRERWWQYSERRPGLYSTIAPLKRVLACSQVTGCLGFAFLPNTSVFANTLIMLAFDDMASFCVIQSRIHEIWARFLGSSMKDDLRYTPSGCFETFPFPSEHQSSEVLCKAGNEYYLRRADFMVATSLGLTKTYNRFHSPEEVDEGILELRRLHGLMDGAVLRAYGWDDLAESAAKSGFCEFLLDYEEEEDDDSLTTKKKSKKKKPWRYRWPDDFRDEVLARLLELNEQRHKEEITTGLETTKPAKKKDSAPKKAVPVPLLPLEKEHRYALMVLRGLGSKAVSQRLLNQCLILMLDDDLRTTLATKGKASAKPTKSKRDNTQLSQFINDLEIDKYIAKVSSKHQAMWQITELAPGTDDSTKEDIQRLTEVMAIVESGSKSGSVTISEETVDGNFDFILA